MNPVKAVVRYYNFLSNYKGNALLGYLVFCYVAAVVTNHLFGPGDTVNRVAHLLFLNFLAISFGIITGGRLGRRFARRMAAKDAAAWAEFDAKILAEFPEYKAPR